MRTDVMVKNRRTDTNSFYELSDEERKALQSCLLSIYRDIKFVCDKYKLTVMLCGGTVLGAVRHKGFIPWDDDLDLMMNRQDYNKLIEVFPQEMGDKYIISYPNKESSSMTLFLKVIKKNTILKYWDDADDYMSGIYVDVFPIDGAPNNVLLRYLKGCLANILRKISTSVKLYKRNNESVKLKMNLNTFTAIYYRISFIIGAIFSIFGEKRIDVCFDRLVSSCKKAKYMAIPTGRKSYFGELLPYNIFFPVSKGVFEGLEVCLPNNTDVYLTNLYGSYMEIPPVEKRERHYFTDFSLNTLH